VKNLEFSIEELKIINYSFKVMSGEMTLSTDELLLARKISETLERWNVDHYKF
jgi:hypothetical protein